VSYPEVLSLWILARAVVFGLGYQWRDRFVLPMCGLYVIELMLVRLNAQSIAGCFRTLPLMSASLVAWSLPLDVLICCVRCLEMVVLAAAYASYTSADGLDRRAMTTFAGGAAFLALASLVVPVINSTDLYVYHSIGEVGFHSYVAGPTALRDAHGSLVRMFPCEKGFYPNAYGPFYSAYLQGLVHVFPDITSFIIALRLQSLAAVLGLFWLMRTLRTSRLLIVLVALDPVLYFQYVANGHNDLIPIDLVLGAMALARRSRVPAVLALLLTGLVKLPLALLGLVSLRGPGHPAKTIMFGAIVLAGSFLIIDLAVGGAYLEGLGWWTTRYREHLPAVESAARFALEFGAVAAIGIALLTDRFYGTATFLMLMLGGLVLQQWYALWALPYALAEKKHAATYLLGIPLFALVNDATISQVVIMPFFLAACCALAIVFMSNIDGKLRLRGPVRSEGYAVTNSITLELP
jgi:hypothetical protein